MQKRGILNPLLPWVLSCLGHKDIILIVDAGFPIPEEVERVDLAVAPNIPRFIDILNVILKEIIVERVIIACETKNVSPHVYNEIIKSLKETQGNIPVEEISHEELKALSTKAKAIIRTGEFTPYANVALVSGVPF